MNKHEKKLKELQKFMEENYEEGMDQEDFSRLAQLFNYQHADGYFSYIDESDDYLERAQYSYDDKEAIKYTKKALKLNPDNLDAETYLIVLTSKNMHELYTRLQETLDKQRKKLRDEGYLTDEYKGVFWGVIETRPFIRLWYRYINVLIEMGMMDRAIEELKEVLIWNEHDNCGGRYHLAHLYAYKQDKEALFDLHKEFDDYEETQFLLPKSILFYKNGDLKEAEKYLKKLEKCNPDIKKLVNPKKAEKLLLEGDEPLMEGAYRPGTYQELFMELDQFSFLFESVPYYLEWANDILNKKGKTKK